MKSSKVRLMVSFQACLAFHCKTNASANHKDMAGVHWRQKSLVSLLLRCGCGPEVTVNVGGCFCGFWRVFFLQKVLSLPTRSFFYIYLANSQKQTFFFFFFLETVFFEISTICNYQLFKRHHEKPLPKEVTFYCCTRMPQICHSINSGYWKILDSCNLQTCSLVGQYNLNPFKIKSPCWHSIKQGSFGNKLCRHHTLMSFSLMGSEGGITSRCPPAFLSHILVHVLSCHCLLLDSLSRLWKLLESTDFIQISKYGGPGLDTK